MYEIYPRIFRFGSSRPCGKNFFNQHLKKYFQLAGIDSPRLTLRSLRTTVATRLNERGVSDDVIRIRTGHKTSAGLDRYKRPELKRNVLSVSDILTHKPTNLYLRYLSGLFLLSAIMIIVASLIYFLF